jgi:hypothetical protein
VIRRLPVLASLAVLLLALGIALAVAVPWTPLPGADLTGDPLRDFTAEQLAREVAFHDAVRPWSYASLLTGLVVAVLLGLTRAGSRIVGALPGGWAGQVVLGTLVLTALGRLVTLPLSARSQAVLQDYGLSTHTWGSWLVDVGKGVLVGAGLTALALVVLVGLARRFRRTWWAWGAAGTAALVVAGSFAYPLVVEPVFNEFEPLPAGELRDDLLALAARDGVQVDEVRSPTPPGARPRSTPTSAASAAAGGSWSTTRCSRRRRRPRWSWWWRTSWVTSRRATCWWGRCSVRWRRRPGCAPWRWSCPGRRCCAGLVRTGWPTRAWCRCCWHCWL